MKNKKPNAVLSKKLGWIIIIILVLLDAILDVIFAHGSGLQSPIWKPVADLLRISNPIFLTPLVLILFYFVVKAGALLAKKIDKVPAYAEELVLTTLVIVYGVFVLWLILVYLFNFRLFRSHLYLIPFLIIIGAVYEWWAEKQLKKN